MDQSKAELGRNTTQTRGIRARYPNANPEIDGFGSNIYAKSWMPPIKKPPLFDYEPLDYPVRNDSQAEWCWYYSLGFGGVCDIFHPSDGYWCTIHPRDGGGVTYVT